MRRNPVHLDLFFNVKSSYGNHIIDLSIVDNQNGVCIILNNTLCQDYDRNDYDILSYKFKKLDSGYIADFFSTISKRKLRDGHKRKLLLSEYGFQ